MLNNGALRDTDVVVFVEFFDEVFGQYHKEPTKIAKVLFNGAQAYLYSNCPCSPMSKGKLIKGQRIYSDTLIGYYAAEGDEIPYNKPHLTIRKDI